MKSHDVLPNARNEPQAERTSCIAAALLPLYWQRERNKKYRNVWENLRTQQFRDLSDVSSRCYRRTATDRSYATNLTTGDPGG